MIAYKVVRACDIENRFYSAVVGGELQVEYVVGKRVSAPMGHLFVFDSVDAAASWLENRRYREYQLWRCQVDELLSYTKVAIVNHGVPTPETLESVSGFWSARTQSPPVCLGLTHCYWGKKLARWVKLLDRVDN